MNSFAFSFDPRTLRLGRSDALDDDGRCVGRWLCLGPIALCWDYD